MSRRIVGLRFSLVMSLGVFWACGVEVGNPTKPSPAPSATDQETLALVSTEQLEETVAAASENQSGTGASELTFDLSLTSATRSCEVNADSSVLYTVDANDTSSTDLPRGAPTRRISQVVSRQLSAILKAQNQAIACRAGGRFPAINWQNLTGFQAEVTAKRSVDRTIKDIGTGTVTDTIHITADGSRQVVWERKALAGDAITLGKTVHFETNLSRSSTLSSTPYQTTVETLDNLVIEQTLQGTSVQSFVIGSGTVLSDYKDGQKLKLSYNNLEFLKGASCYPESGSIAAAIYNPTDLNNAILSYTIVFESGNASLVFGDGTRKELLLTDCSIRGN